MTRYIATSLLIILLLAGCFSPSDTHDRDAIFQEVINGMPEYQDFLTVSDTGQQTF